MQAVIFPKSCQLQTDMSVQGFAPLGQDARATLVQKIVFFSLCCSRSLSSSKSEYVTLDLWNNCS